MTNPPTAPATPAAAPPLVDARQAAAPPPLLVPAAEAARLCGVGRTLWLQLASAGRVPMPVHLGRRTLWRREELAAWCAAGLPGRDRWIALQESHTRSGA
jgi:predicted DNA-binding transcriptional regulator AlpA